MITLGLNGWTVGSHDASAAIVRDGKVVAFCEEERFSRRKRALDVRPHTAVAACLYQSGISLSEVDSIATGWDYPARHNSRRLNWNLSENEYLDAMLPTSLFGRRNSNVNHVFVEHHLAHASSAFFGSGFDEAAIVVLDGQGEDASGIIAKGAGGKITILERFDVASSLGYFYEAACEFAGFDSHDAGKLMGLAAHGRVDDSMSELFEFENNSFRPKASCDVRLLPGRIDERKQMIEFWRETFRRDWRQDANSRVRYFDNVQGRLRIGPKRDPYDFRDFAATAQATLERYVREFIHFAIKRTGISKVVIAGGVGLNASANGNLNADVAISDFWVQPAAGDAGVSLGAAMWLQAVSGVSVSRMHSASVGLEFHPDSIKAVLDRIGLAYKKVDDPSSVAAKILGAGRITAWFQGQAEVGPRALGNRSLLSIPGGLEIRNKINGQVKDREWWRPLAASMLEEDAHMYIVSPRPLPFMIVTAAFREEQQGIASAAIHVDGTTRPQTVNPEQNETYHRLLCNLKSINGHGIVLNTSLNGGDEPICSSPLDALRFFMTSRADCCIIGPFCIEKGK